MKFQKEDTYNALNWKHTAISKYIFASIMIFNIWQLNYVIWLQSILMKTDHKFWFKLSDKHCSMQCHKSIPTIPTLPCENGYREQDNYKTLIIFLIVHIWTRPQCDTKRKHNALNKISTNKYHRLVSENVKILADHEMYELRRNQSLSCSWIFLLSLNLSPDEHD